MRVHRVSAPVTHTRKLAPAEPVSVPGVDALRAQVAACGPGGVHVTHGYLLHVFEGHGCSGTAKTLTLFDPNPWTLDAWEQFVSEADDAAAAALALRRQAALAAAGAKPRWDANWPGTRGEYDTALRTWEQAAHVEAHPWDALIETVSAGRRALTTTGWVDAVNTDRDDPDHAGVRALVAHLERGCRCACSSRWVAGVNDLRDDLGLSPADAWPMPAGDGTDRWLSPPVSVLTFPRGQQLLCTGHVDASSGVTAVQAVLARFDARLEAAVAQRRDDLAAFAELYDDDALDGCAYAEYELHKDDPRKRRSAQYGLSSPLDALALLEKQLTSSAMTGLGHDVLADWVASFEQ